MPLTLQLTRRPDGQGSLVLIRPDGSRTWQRQKERHAAFFAQHDLTHFAVESMLGLRQAFYGLVADGWDFTDFAQPWPRGPLPDEALWAESVVGLLDVERATLAAGGELLSAGEFETHVRNKLAEGGRRPPRSLDAVTLMALRARRDALFAEWAAVQPGERLELVFAP